MQKINAFLLEAVVVLAFCGPSAQADFLDITSLTPGTAGTFSGTLIGVNVTGALTVNTTQFNGFSQPYYQWTAAVSANPNFDASVINGTSPQYSYSNIYSPSAPLVDQIGYDQFASTAGTATATIAFASAITNPIFHVANMDSSQYDFSATPGLTGLVLLSGNGGSGDGLAVTGKVIFDANFNTVVGQAVTDPPFTSNARSAYGSVELLGSFTTLTFNVTLGSNNGDGGNFTLSAVPEPSSLVLLGLGAVGVSIAARRRRSASSH